MEELGRSVFKLEFSMNMPQIISNGLIVIIYIY